MLEGFGKMPHPTWYSMLNHSMGQPTVLKSVMTAVASRVVSIVALEAMAEVRMAVLQSRQPARDVNVVFRRQTPIICNLRQPEKSTVSRLNITTTSSLSVMKVAR